MLSIVLNTELGPIQEVQLSLNIKVCVSVSQLAEQSTISITPN